MSEPSILYTIEGQVARVLLNRPEVFNSFNREMALSLQEVLQDCKRKSCSTGHLFKCQWKGILCRARHQRTARR